MLLKEVSYAQQDIYLAIIIFVYVMVHVFYV